MKPWNDGETPKRVRLVLRDTGRHPDGIVGLRWVLKRLARSAGWQCETIEVLEVGTRSARPQTPAG